MSLNELREASNYSEEGINYNIVFNFKLLEK